MSSCKYCEFFIFIYFEEHLRTASSLHIYFFNSLVLVILFFCNFFFELERAKQTAMVGSTLAKLDKAIETITTNMDKQVMQAAAGNGVNGAGGTGAAGLSGTLSGAIASSGNGGGGGTGGGGGGGANGGATPSGGAGGGGNEAGMAPKPEPLNGGAGGTNVASEGKPDGAESTNSIPMYKPKGAEAFSPDSYSTNKQLLKLESTVADLAEKIDAISDKVDKTTAGDTPLNPFVASHQSKVSEQLGFMGQALGKIAGEVDALKELSKWKATADAAGAGGPNGAVSNALINANAIQKATDLLLALQKGQPSPLQQVVNGYTQSVRSANNPVATPDTGTAAAVLATATVNQALSAIKNAAKATGLSGTALGTALASSAHDEPSSPSDAVKQLTKLMKAAAGPDKPTNILSVSEKDGKGDDSGGGKRGGANGSEDSGEGGNGDEDGGGKNDGGGKGDGGSKGGGDGKQYPWEVKYSEGHNLGAFSPGPGTGVIGSILGGLLGGPSVAVPAGAANLAGAGPMNLGPIAGPMAPALGAGLAAGLAGGPGAISPDETRIHASSLVAHGLPPGIAGTLGVSGLIGDGMAGLFNGGAHHILGDDSHHTYTDTAHNVYESGLDGGHSVTLPGNSESLSADPGIGFGLGWLNTHSDLTGTGRSLAKSKTPHYKKKQKMEVSVEEDEQVDQLIDSLKAVGVLNDAQFQGLKKLNNVANTQTDPLSELANQLNVNRNNQAEEKQIESLPKNFANLLANSHADNLLAELQNPSGVMTSNNYEYSNPNNPSLTNILANALVQSILAKRGEVAGFKNLTASQKKELNSLLNHEIWKRFGKDEIYAKKYINTATHSETAKVDHEDALQTNQITQIRALTPQELKLLQGAYPTKGAIKVNQTNVVTYDEFLNEVKDFFRANSRNEIASNQQKKLNLPNSKVKSYVKIVGKNAFEKFSGFRPADYLEIDQKLLHRVAPGRYKIVKSLKDLVEYVTEGESVAEKRKKVVIEEKPLSHSIDDALLNALDKKSNVEGRNSSNGSIVSKKFRGGNEKAKETKTYNVNQNAEKRTIVANKEQNVTLASSEKNVIGRKRGMESRYIRLSFA